MDESKLHPSDTWNFTAGEPHIHICSPLHRTHQQNTILHRA
jgi:hypothetical protein